MTGCLENVVGGEILDEGLECAIILRSTISTIGRARHMHHLPQNEGDIKY
jgi:hypothetical protein